jgi:hypothetical protein
LCRLYLYFEGTRFESRPIHPLFTPTYFIITLSTPKYMHANPLQIHLLPNLIRMTVAVYIRQINNRTCVRELWGTDIYPEFIRNINGISAYRVIWTVLPTRWNDSTVDLCGKLTWVCRTTHCCYLAWGLKNSKCFWSDSLRCSLPQCRACHLLDIRMVRYKNNCHCYTA